MGQKSLKALKNNDVFGETVYFTYNQDRFFKTLPGAVATILMYVTLLVIALSTF